MVGFCCTEPVAARHIYEPSRQMHNRGNGKGGGIAALGFVPEQLGVSREVLEDYYMLHIAFLDTGVRADLEKKYITPVFRGEGFAASWIRWTTGLRSTAWKPNRRTSGAISCA